MKWYLKVVIEKFFTFSGRARRAEYWNFILFHFMISAVLSVIDQVIGTYDTETYLGYLAGGYVLGFLFPSVSVAIRRLHDTDRSGWWILLLPIPIVGLLVFLYFMLQEGDPGQNQYGPNPKSAG